MKFILIVCSLSFCVLVDSTKIIIVGAGAAGISAATRLIENNITDFIFLEAEPRLGGRIQSIPLDDGLVDLGGEYVIGEDGNVVYELAKEALKPRLKTKKTKSFYSDGEPINDELSQEILDFRNSLVSFYEDKKPISARDAFIESIFLLNPQAGKSWMRSVNSLNIVPGMPKVLMVGIAGPEVPYIEKLPIEEMKNGVNKVIKKFIGKKFNVMEPSITIPWNSNPNFRGTYFYEAMESASRSRQAQDDLAEPLLNSQGVPVVLFAGEHTSKYHFSTVHGAAESGYRAADELIQYLNKKQ